MSNTDTVPFEAPSAGSWELDLAHFSPDCSRMVRDAVEAAMTIGIRAGFDLVGAPVATMDAAFLNGRFYRRLVPLIGAGRNMAEPPAALTKLVARFHPEFRRRAKTAAAAVEGRIWNDELERWKSEWKPELVDTSRRLGALDLEALSDDELASVLEEAYAHVVRGLTLHFRLHISDLGPIGLLLVRGRDHGFEAVELMACLSGYSHATSAPSRSLAKIARLVDGPLRSLDDVNAAGPDAAGALDEFLAEYGNRLTGGYDLGDPILAEMPATIVAGINAARAPGDLDAAKKIGDETAERLRAQLSEADQPGFDAILADARALYGLRDENGPVTYQWPAGILRRITNHAAERLVERALITEADRIHDLSAEEIAACLRGHPVASSEIERRYKNRKSWLDLDAPRLLGPEPVSPDLAVLPGPLAELMDAVLLVLEQIESPLQRTGLSGVGIGDQTYVGRARVVHDALDALAAFEEGDILVAPFTVPTINTVLAIAGAVVTEEGGLLSHAAVIAREFGIPGVIGVDGAAELIPDGATVRVDAASGTLELL